MFRIAFQSEVFSWVVVRNIIFEAWLEDHFHRTVTRGVFVQLILWFIFRLIWVLTAVFSHLVGRVWRFLTLCCIVWLWIIVNRLSEILFVGTLLMLVRFLWEKIKLISVVVFPCATVVINSLFRLILYRSTVRMSLLGKSVSHEIVLICNWAMMTIIKIVFACTVATLHYIWLFLFFKLSISLLLQKVTIFICCGIIWIIIGSYWIWLVLIRSWNQQVWIWETSMRFLFLFILHFLLSFS